MSEKNKKISAEVEVNEFLLLLAGMEDAPVEAVLKLFGGRIKIIDILIHYFVMEPEKLNDNNTYDTFKQILKETVVASINATIISLLVYLYNFIRFGATATVTYSVSISLFAVVMFASIFGTFVPMTLEKLKIDPAIATGPFISITNDIIGMMLYMGITVLLS